MSNGEDVGIEMAREGAQSGLEEFKATLAFFQNNPNPDPRARPAGGVALPSMGRRPGPARPPQPARPGPQRPGPPKPGARKGVDGAPSSRELADWQKKADRLALQTMLEARRDFVPKLFEGARVQYKGGKNPAQEVRKAAKDFQKGAERTRSDAEKGAKQGRSMGPSSGPAKKVDAAKLGKQLFRKLGELDEKDLAGLEGVITDIAGDVFSDIGSSVLPLVGTAKAGARAGIKWGKTGRKHAQVRKAREARGKVIQGDPEKAVNSVKRLLERERNLLGSEAGIATAKLGSDVAGYFVDLGIASGIASGCAEAVGRLTLHIRMIVRDAMEMKVANELLQSGRLDARIFSECPLLGAYAVAAADTSALVGFLGGDPQRHGFSLDDLSKVIRKYNDPLVRYATEIIGSSRLEVTGMPTNRAQARAKAQADRSNIRMRIAKKVKAELERSARR